MYTLLVKHAFSFKAISSSLTSINFLHIYQLTVIPIRQKRTLLKSTQDDLDISALPAEFQVLRSVFKNVKFDHFVACLTNELEMIE